MPYPGGMARPSANQQKERGLPPESPEDMADLVKMRASLDRTFGVQIGGIRRPWAKKILPRPKELQKVEGTMILWEGGAKTTLDLKFEIKELLENGYSLIELLDSKRLEHPENPYWWPSLMEVMSWCKYDHGFAQLLDMWTHARQLEILEGITHNVMNPMEAGIDSKTLKVQADFAAKVLPRIVNPGLVDRTEVKNTTNTPADAYRQMSDEAIEARLAELGANPKVRVAVQRHMGATPEKTLADKKPASDLAEKAAKVIDVDIEIPVLDTREIEDDR